MLNFIHPNLSAIIPSALLVGMFAYVIYLNVAYANEKKAEANRRELSLVHGTCEYDSTAQDRIFAEKTINATLDLGMGFLDLMMQAVIKDIDKDLKAILADANAPVSQAARPQSPTVH
jgi:hypothetical protein